MWHQLFIQHTDDNLIAAILTVQFGDCRDDRFRLIGRSLHHAQLFWMKIDQYLLPSLWNQAAVFVKSLGQANVGMNQGRHVVRDLVQHSAHGDVHVAGADQHDLLIRATQAMFDRVQASRLEVPQAQPVKDREIPHLHLTEQQPAFRFLEAGH